ncbi:MAG TPA: pyridoxal phosphate-dependent aminotransferase [Chloroflexota bacterium]|nr:pyridoxal phosphate-dependent aminotransferase [Chloroflexota bacterium]
MSDMKLANAMSRLGTETAFDVLAKARALEALGRSVIHLEIGEPDFDTPRHITEAGVEALRSGATHYTPSAGIPELRLAIAQDAGRLRGMEFRPSEVVVTPGAKPIMFFGLMALVDPGDEVIYPNPGFPIYESVINFLGGKAVPVPLREDNDFAFDLDLLRSNVNERTKLIVINSPQNPTGGVLNRAAIEEIARLAEAFDCWVLSDEIYDRMLYEGEHVSIAALPGMRERTIILDGFSKTYAMTGWRLGYGIMPEALADQIAKLMTNSASCTAAFTQLAGIAALQGPQDAVTSMVAEFRARRDLVVAGLNAIPGISCRLPKGAFYAFPNVTGTGQAAGTLADYLLAEHGVATLAGTSFGEYGEGYLRLSYANSQANLREALKRMGEAVAALGR